MPIRSPSVDHPTITTATTTATADATATVTTTATTTATTTRQASNRPPVFRTTAVLAIQLYLRSSGYRVW